MFLITLIGVNMSVKLINHYVAKACEVVAKMPVSKRETFTYEKVQCLAMDMLLNDLNDVLVNRTSLSAEVLVPKTEPAAKSV